MTDNSIDATLTKAGASSRTASQHLEQAFEKERERRRRRRQDEHRGKEETETAGTASDPHVVPPMQLPNPIQLVHRLSVLEGALTQLGHDCDTLAHQRKTIVQSVLTEQQQTTAKLFEFDPQILKVPPPPPDSNERISEMMRTLSILFDAS